jgi:hypothetical protein
MKVPYDKLRFYAFQHPYVCSFIEALQRDGVPTLLTLENQRWRRDDAAQKDTTSPWFVDKLHGLFFKSQYAPADLVATPYPSYNVDFDLEGRTGTYAEYKLGTVLPHSLTHRNTPHARRAAR